VTASGQPPAPTARADAIDRWFARIFVAIAGLSWAGLLLAEVGAFRLGPLALLGGGVVAVGLVVIEAALRRDSRKRTSTASAFVVIALVAVAMAVVLPPGDPIVAGADESVYLHLASGIRRSGAILSSDPLLEETPQDDWPRLFSRDRYWPQRLNRFDGGVQIADSGPILQPGFFHLLPVAIAGVETLVGDRAGAYVPPVFAVLGMVALFLLARRLISAAAAVGAAGLVAISLAEAWCGRQPLSELPTQYFVMSGLLFFTWWHAERSVAAALLSGVAFGLAAFTRLDVLMLVTPMLILVLAVCWWDRLASRAAPSDERRALGRGLTALTITVVVVTGHALVHAATIAQPYTLRIGRHFLRDRTLPAFVVAAAALAAFAAIAALGHRRRWKVAALSRYLGPAIALVTIAIVLRHPQRLLESPLIYLLTGPGLALAAVGLVTWSWRDDASSWLVLLLAAASAVAYLDMPRDLPEMPSVFRRTLPVLFPLAALLLGALLVPPDARRWRRIAGAVAFLALGVAGARHITSIIGRPIPVGGRAALMEIARDVPASALLIVDGGFPSHAALALDFSLGRTAISGDFVFREDAPDRRAALSRLIAHIGATSRDVFFLGSASPSTLPTALPAGWTPFPVTTTRLEYEALERRRTGWPSEVQKVEQPVTLYRLVPPQGRIALPMRVDIGGPDLQLSQGGWYPAEAMLGTGGRWTGPSATARLPAAACPSDRRLVLQIRAATLRPAGLIQPRVRLSLNDTPIGELGPADSAFRVYALGLPLAAVSQVCTAPSTLGIETGTFVPARDAGSPDRRELGLAVDWVELTPDAGRNLRE